MLVSWNRPPSIRKATPAARWPSSRGCRTLTNPTPMRSSGHHRPRPVRAQDARAVQGEDEPHGDEDEAERGAVARGAAADGALSRRVPRGSRAAVSAARPPLRLEQDHDPDHDQDDRRRLPDSPGHEPRLWSWRNVPIAVRTRPNTWFASSRGARRSGRPLATSRRGQNRNHSAKGPWSLHGRRRGALALRDERRPSESKTWSSQREMPYGVARRSAQHAHVAGGRRRPPARRLPPCAVRHPADRGPDGRRRSRPAARSPSRRPTPSSAGPCSGGRRRRGPRSATAPSRKADDHRVSVSPSTACSAANSVRGLAEVDAPHVVQGEEYAHHDEEAFPRPPWPPAPAAGPATLRPVRSIMSTLSRTRCGQAARAGTFKSVSGGSGPVRGGSPAPPTPVPRRPNHARRPVPGRR